MERPAMTDRWRTVAGATLRHLEALLLPRACLGCERPIAGAREAMVCETCWTRLAWLPHPRCQRCGHPGGHAGSGAECRWCPLLPPYVRAVRSCCWVPGGTAERLLYAFKYEGWHRLGHDLAGRMARLDWPEDVRRRAAFDPMPLSAERRRARLQSECVLARTRTGAGRGARPGRRTGSTGQRAPLPVWDDVIERPRRTTSQTRLTPEQRLYNVAHAFRVVAGAPAKLCGAHVMLVDDVVTTAATLNECAATLWDAGARIISYVTFGRARHGRRRFPRG
jgi:predicted amidophosphoribosyltransferase